MFDFLKNMSEERFSELSLAILLTSLMILMGFIIYDLAKKSKAGKYGTLILFFVLGFGAIGFIFKSILTEILG
jgi:uncharacterized membrane protein YkvI